jgi:hypothetical protein
MVEDELTDIKQTYEAKKEDLERDMAHDLNLEKSRLERKLEQEWQAEKSEFLSQEQELSDD